MRSQVLSHVGDAQLSVLQLVLAGPVRVAALGQLESGQLGDRDFELGPNTAYDNVWARDAIDATHTEFAVEAAAAVLLSANDCGRGNELVGL